MHSARSNISVVTLALLSAVLLIATSAAHAQTETVLYNFTGGSDGAIPRSTLTLDATGNLYGTTTGGGSNKGGTVFELSPDGGGGWNETVLYSFCSAPNCVDGQGPNYSGVIFDSEGNLYGTTVGGGAYGTGAVFELSPVGTSWTEAVLYSLDDGGSTYPVNGLISDSAGNLYGATTAGVFELSPPGGWTEQTIYADYGNLLAGLTIDPAGNIFGVGDATAFELSPNGNGSWNPTVIHDFAGGAIPTSTLVLDNAGNIYGTALKPGSGVGEVYKLIPGKKGKWSKEILYSVRSGSPRGTSYLEGLVLDAAGNIYGDMTADKHGNGTVFELVAPSGKGSYQGKVLWSFNGADGNQPLGGLLLDSAGNLYGTTAEGGSYGYGVVFEVTP